jgi:hypothetical protein
MALYTHNASLNFLVFIFFYLMIIIDQEAWFI